MRTVFLHVGPMKTGTTAIQHCFASNDDAPLFYPRVGPLPNRAHHKLVLSYFGKQTRTGTVPPSSDTLFEDLKKGVAADRRDVLISSEILPRYDVGAFIGALEQALSGLVQQFKPVIVCREHFARAASFFNQSVKGPTCQTAAPDRFLRRRAASLAYRPLIEELMKTGREVIVVNYHGPGDLVQRFASALGVDAALCKPSERKNISVSTKGLIPLLVINRVVGRGDEREAYVARLKQMPGFFSGSSYIFGAAAAARANEVFAADRRFLEQQFGIVFPEAAAAPAEGAFALSEKDYQQIETVIGGFDPNSEAVLAGVREHVHDKAAAANRPDARHRPAAHRSSGSAG